MEVEAKPLETKIQLRPNQINFGTVLPYYPPDDAFLLGSAVIQTRSCHPDHPLRYIPRTPVSSEDRCSECGGSFPLNPDMRIWICTQPPCKFKLCLECYSSDVTSVKEYQKLCERVLLDQTELPTAIIELINAYALPTPISPVTSKYEIPPVRPYWTESKDFLPYHLRGNKNPGFIRFGLAIIGAVLPMIGLIWGGLLHEIVGCPVGLDVWMIVYGALGFCQGLLFLGREYVLYRIFAAHNLSNLSLMGIIFHAWKIGIFYNPILLTLGGWVVYGFLAFSSVVGHHECGPVHEFISLVGIFAFVMAGLCIARWIYLMYWTDFTPVQALGTGVRYLMLCRRNMHRLDRARRASQEA